MSNFDWKTKKEKILENARRDPFLKIEDLAKIADTTPRYVRTILSEANMSLMELRREYARKMENKNNNICDKILFNYLINVPFTTDNKILMEDKIIFNESADFNLLSGNISDDHYFFSYLHLIREKPWCVSTVLVKREEITKGFNKMEPGQLFTHLCKILENKEAKISNIDLEINPSTNQIANLLDISPLTPLLRVRQSLELGSQAAALIVLYFNYNQVSLSLSYSNGIVINRRGYK